MKTINSNLVAFTFFAVIATSCQKEIKISQTEFSESSAKANTQPTPAICNGRYNVILESGQPTANNGLYTWIWSIQNPNPGNGTNGTVQDLSHWGMQFGHCFNWSHVVSSAYSYNGSTWHSFTPEYKIDKSQNCITTPVFKFDAGTNGSAKTYYRLVLNTYYPSGNNAFGNFKSGSSLPCCTFNFNGISCNE